MLRSLTRGLFSDFQRRVAADPRAFSAPVLHKVLSAKGLALFRDGMSESDVADARVQAMRDAEKPVAGGGGGGRPSSSSSSSRLRRMFSAPSKPATPLVGDDKEVAEHVAFATYGADDTDYGGEDEITFFKLDHASGSVVQKVGRVESFDLSSPRTAERRSVSRMSSRESTLPSAEGI